MNETKQEFMDRYETDLGIADLFKTTVIALPCNCGGSTHWAAVSRDPRDVRMHLDLYAPGTPWPEEITNDEESQA